MKEAKHHLRMIRRPTGQRRFNAFKPKRLKIKLIYEDIDYAHGVGVRHVVVERFGKKKALSTIVALNEPLHLAPLRYRTRHFSNLERCFDTVWANLSHSKGILNDRF